MSGVVSCLASEHPAWCGGGPCELRIYPDGAREEAHMRDLPGIPGAGRARVWLSRIVGTAADGAVRYREDAVGVDQPIGAMSAEVAEQLARDLAEAARLLRADAPAGSR